MPALSMLIKPASASCNMRCEYCFYNDVAASREVANYGIMSYETLETIVKKAFEYADQSISFGFQGGEPTMAGLDFFKKAVELQQKYNVKRIPVQNALQTNGINIDGEWAEFFCKNKFLIGLSLDGTKAIHDKYRLDRQGGGTFDRVIAAAAVMDKHHAEYNILTTVNIDVAYNIDKIYYLFKKHKFNYLQFIPCLDEFSGKRREYSLTSEAYGEFLVTLFKLWYVDICRGTPVSIRLFDNLALMLAGYPPESCGMAGVCSCYYLIEADGGVYPCDFYVTDEWRIGNILTDGWEEMRQTENGRRFVEVSKQIAPECKECEYFMICRGGCRRNREPISLEKNGLNEFCGAFKKFYGECLEDLQKVADRFLSRK